MTLFARFTALFTRRGKKSETKDEEDGGPEQEPKEGELKRSASADDIREATDEAPKRRRFDSFRRSFRRLTPGGQKKKKNKEEQKKKREEGKEAEADGGDDGGTGAVGVTHTTAAENDVDKGDGSGSIDSVDVTVEVHDSS